SRWRDAESGSGGHPNCWCRISGTSLLCGVDGSAGVAPRGLVRRVYRRSDQHGPPDLHVRDCISVHPVRPTHSTDRRSPERPDMEDTIMVQDPTHARSLRDSRMMRRPTLAVGVAASSLLLTACGGGAVNEGGEGEGDA